MRQRKRSQDPSIAEKQAEYDDAAEKAEAALKDIISTAKKQGLEVTALTLMDWWRLWCRDCGHKRCYDVANELFPRGKK